MVLFQPEKDKIRCLACNHYCLLAEGRRGICGVRENRNGELKLLVHSKVIAKHIDPIEKKPLYHFLPGTAVYSIGTIGCNMKCSFCQNWNISQQKEVAGQDLSPEKVKEEAAPYPSIAYTYNEPTIFLEYAQDIAALTPDKKHVFVTNGYFSSQALEQMNFVSALNIDLKSFNPNFYKTVCGGELYHVLNNIKKCHSLSKWVEVTTLLIPRENSSEEEIRDIAKFIASIDKEIPWHISAFHPDFKMLSKAPTAFSALEKAYRIAKEEGLAYVYLGNVLNEQYSSTFCPQCQKLLIRRKGYLVKVEGMKDGKCAGCGHGIKGVWG